jgi:hypothetical protein
MEDDVPAAGRLAKLESHATATEARLTTVERTLDIHGGKLDRIVQAVTATNARREFDPAAVVSFIKDSTILIGMMATAIIYIATNIADKPVSLLQQHQATIEKRIDAIEGRTLVVPKGVQQQ